MSEEQITWDDAVSSSAFVRLETDTQKVLTCKNPQLVKVEKFGDEVIEFQADVEEEDGNACGKLFTTSSKRLKSKLRPIFENVKPGEIVKLSILKVGDKFDTQYSVKKL
jgi:hypothetical protein